MGVRVVELFAGVGGFRLGLERAGGFQVAWSNQWEPAARAQHASDCYVRHFGAAGHVNADVGAVPADAVPPHDLLVGGFPCQDYSVATTLDKAGGLQGRKGVLWWEIHRLLAHRRPPLVLLENVDRLLRSPARQRGRDFGVMLACFARLGYAVEWRVLNAGDHGAPTRRKRTFILAARADTSIGRRLADAAPRGPAAGFFGGPFPVAEPVAAPRGPDTVLDEDVRAVSDGFAFDFLRSGAMLEGRVWTQEATSVPAPAVPLAAVLERDVPEEFWVPKARLEEWRYLKGAKSEPRTAATGYDYLYKEGPVAFPDPVDRSARAILTGEGPGAPNRSTHVVADPAHGRLRFLTPVECERVMGFPDGWTEGLPRRWRYFTMGNALVVGLVERMGRHLQEWLAEAGPAPVPAPAPAAPVSVVKTRRAARRHPSKP